MSVVGVPVGGLKTVGRIVATNTLTFRAGQNALAIGKGWESGLLREPPRSAASLDRTWVRNGH